MNVVLSYGLGADSTSLLLRWLLEPSCRDFDLGDLLVVTAMTGSERARTAPLVEQHILPRLRAAGIRFAQVARAGPRQADGIRVLEDSTSPRRLFVRGAYTLADELTAAGTVPQAAGGRRCSMKFKGWVIDRYLADFAPKATRHAFGYEVDEQTRARECARRMPGRLVLGYEINERQRAQCASTYDGPHRAAEFPLLEWGWTRLDCERYIETITGVPDWPKSACGFCPFSLTSRRGRAESLVRFDDEPESALEALMLEWRALCLNPRGGLIAGARLVDLLAEQRPQLLAAFWGELERTRHAVYEVRRLWRPRADDPTKALANRDVRILMEGSRSACVEHVQRLGGVDRHDGIERAYQLRRRTQLPTREQFVVAGPAGAVEKRVASFDRMWGEIASDETGVPVDAV